MNHMCWGKIAMCTPVSDLASRVEAHIVGNILGQCNPGRGEASNQNRPSSNSNSDGDRGNHRPISSQLQRCAVTALELIGKAVLLSSSPQSQFGSPIHTLGQRDEVVTLLAQWIGNISIAGEGFDIELDDCELSDEETKLCARPEICRYEDERKTFSAEGKK